MEINTIVRQNLMKDVNYRPYCGNDNSSTIFNKCSCPRTIWNGGQFQCPECEWVSSFPKDFIAEYKKKHNLS